MGRPQCRGATHRGKARLTYRLLEPPVITAPAAGAGKLPISGAAVRWERVVGARTIHLEVEQPAAKRVLTADLDGEVTSFVIPDGFLKRGGEYVLDVKAVGANGNLSVADRVFRTG